MSLMIRKNPLFFGYFHKLSKYPKIFQKAQKLREEMHFEIYKSEPYMILI